MKHRKLIYHFIIWLFLILPELINAQGTFPILKMDVQRISIANDTSGGLPDLSDSTIFRLTMNVSLFDTIDIDKICVVLSDSGGIGNRLQHTFDWDVSGSTGGGTSYLRSEYDLSMGLGDFKDLLNYEATVQIKRTDGSLTELISFSR
jgi:hypothetical protein